MKFKIARAICWAFVAVAGLSVAFAIYKGFQSDPAATLWLLSIFAIAWLLYWASTT